MAKRKRSEYGFTRQSIGPYQITRWDHCNRILISKLPRNSRGFIEQLDAVGVGPTLDVGAELAELKAAVPGLQEADYVDKLMSNRRHEVVFISIDA